MDDLSKRGPEDRSRVSTTEEWELRYWSDKFDVTFEELREAVREAGPSVKKVQAYLEAKKESGAAKHGEQ